MRYHMRPWDGRQQIRVLQVRVLPEEPFSFLPDPAASCPQPVHPEKPMDEARRGTGLGAHRGRLGEEETRLKTARGGRPLNDVMRRPRPPSPRSRAALRRRAEFPQVLLGVGVGLL
jgi:hypothetical protein